jgi:hypothetical protein
VSRSNALRVLLLLAPIALLLVLRAARAFGTHDVLDWDETYYLSLAMTRASGGGLYPYIYGFGPMHVMGGIGYGTYAYVLAVKAFGPTIFALRGVSLVASVLGLAGMWVLVRTLYGSAAAWIAAGVTTALRLFVLSNTGRFDSFVFAYVAWALAAAAIAFDRSPNRRWHFVAGLIFGLGTQVHIDTLVTAGACAVVYVVRREGRTFLSFLGGLAAGLAIYVAVNVLPDIASYYTMTVRVRLDATNAYSSGTSNILASFLDPRILLSKEATRYRQLWSLTPWFEIALVGAGLVACALRRTAADIFVLTVALCVPIGAAILLNNASPLYYIHVLPALIFPIAPLVSHGLTHQSRIALGDLSRWRLVAAVILVALLTLSTGASTLRAIRKTPVTPLAPEDVLHLKAVVDRRCIIATDGRLYVPYFAEYPWLISTRPTEVSLAMLYHRTDDEAAYWQIKRPDVIFSREPLRPALANYVSSHGLEMVSPGLWMNPAGCRQGP